MPSSESSSSTSMSLLQRVKDLDPEAWEQLSMLYGPVVYHWARQAGLQSSDAADLGQEVFRTVAVRIQSFRRDRQGDTFRGWLWGVTRNKLLEYFRNRARTPQPLGGSTVDHRLEDPIIGESADTMERDDLRADVVHRVLELIRSEFEPTTWTAFWRMVVDGQSAPDIGQDLNMTAKAVRQAKYRVIRRLRGELDDLG